MKKNQANEYVTEGRSKEAQRSQYPVKQIHFELPMRASRTNQIAKKGKGEKARMAQNSNSIVSSIINERMKDRQSMPSQYLCLNQVAAAVKVSPSPQTVTHGQSIYPGISGPQVQARVISRFSKTRRSKPNASSGSRLDV